MAGRTRPRRASLRGADTVMTESIRGFGRVSGAMVVVMAMVLALAAPTLASAQQPEAASQAAAQAAPRGGGEANLVLPDLAQVPVGSYNGRTMLMIGLGVSAFGLLFGLVVLNQLKILPVHRSMVEVSEVIYERCN